MPGLTKCQPLLIVLGAKEERNQHCPARSGSVTACKRAQEEEEAEKLPFSLLTGERIRRDDWRGFMKEKGVCWEKKSRRRRWER